LIVDDYLLPGLSWLAELVGLIYGHNTSDLQLFGELLDISLTTVEVELHGSHSGSKSGVFIVHDVVLNFQISVQILDFFVFNLLKNGCLVSFSCLLGKTTCSRLSHSFIEITAACEKYVSAPIIMNNLLDNLSSVVRACFCWIHNWSH
jgi:hypothetical protein